MCSTTLNGGFTDIAEGIEALVICDAGPLIHLDELNCLDLLRAFELIIPEVVLAETLCHRPDIHLPVHRVEPSGEFRKGREIQHLQLDAGELSAIELVMKYSGSVLLTDDGAARTAAKLLCIEVSGTLGILLRAARTKVRTIQEIRVLLGDLRSRSSLYVRQDLLARVLSELDTFARGSGI